MRDPDRIDNVLEELESYWKANPDLRLGQIVTNANGGTDPFYMEDGAMLHWLNSQTYKQKPGMEIEICGRGDDRVCVSGDLKEEYPVHYKTETKVLRIEPHGIIVVIKYDKDGNWKITADANDSTKHMDIGEGPVGYSETLIVRGDQITVEEIH